MCITLSVILKIENSAIFEVLNSYLNYLCLYIINDRTNSKHPSTLFMKYISRIFLVYALSLTIISCKNASRLQQNDVVTSDTTKTDGHPSGLCRAIFMK